MGFNDNVLKVRWIWRELMKGGGRPESGGV